MVCYIYYQILFNTDQLYMNFSFAIDNGN